MAGVPAQAVTTSGTGPASMTILGKYGSLLVKPDGSFTYTLLTATGTSVSNTLSFTVDMDLHPIAEVSYTSFLTGEEASYELPSAAPHMQRSLFMAQAQGEGDEGLSDDPALDAPAADSLFEPRGDAQDLIELPEDPALADQIDPDQAAADRAAPQDQKAEAEVVALDPPLLPIKLCNILKTT